jgi:hypothetical protein
MIVIDTFLFLEEMLIETPKLFFNILIVHQKYYILRPAEMLLFNSLCILQQISDYACQKTVASEWVISNLK